MRETPAHQPRVLLDRSSPVPLYHQMAAAIRELITSGELPPGTRLENEVAMASRLGVSRPTARQALQDLVNTGLLVRRRGVGTQVASEVIRRPMELTSLQDDLAAAGRAPRTEVLAYDVVTAHGPVAEALRCPLGASIVTMRRLRYADDQPLAILTNHLRVEVAPSRELLEEHGLYDALREQGVQIRVAHQSIGARLATAAEARLLQERPRAALLTMERIALDDSDSVVEYGTHVYRAQRYTFDTTLIRR